MTAPDDPRPPEPPPARGAVPAGGRWSDDDGWGDGDDWSPVRTPAGDGAPGGVGGGPVDAGGGSADAGGGRPDGEPPGVAVPRPRGRRRSRRRAPALVAAGVAATLAALQSYAVITVAAVLTSVSVRAHVGPGTLGRMGAVAWLVGHGVPVRAGGGVFALIPLTFTAFAAWRVYRAGVHTTRAIGGRRTGSARYASVAATAVALCYGLLGWAASALARMRGVVLDGTRAGLTLAGFALLFAYVGALRETGAGRLYAGRLPVVVRDGLRTGAAAAALILGAGAAAAGMAVALSGGEARDVLASWHVGVSGQAGLTLLCLLYAPNMAVWAGAYLVGPGFHIGDGTTISAARVTYGPGGIPALPALAGLPSGAVSWYGGILLGAPAAAGAAAGWLLARRRLREAARERRAVPVSRLLLPAVVAGPVAGTILALAAWASGGSFTVRYPTVGPVAWEVGAVTVAGVVAGAVVGIAFTRLVSPLRPATGRAAPAKRNATGRQLATNRPGTAGTAGPGAPAGRRGAQTAAPRPPR